MGTGSNRNQPCNCGSGKKFKNCCFVKRKDRTYRINIDPQNLDLFDGLAFSPDGQLTGHINGFPVPLIGETTIEAGFKTDKKFKVFAKGPIPVDKLFLNPSLSLTTFDHVFAIDTNTAKIGPNKVSVSALLHCIIEPFDEKRASIKYAFQGCYEYHNINGKPENMAWMELNKLIMKEKDFQDKRIGILTDSDLGNHDSYNSRLHPIFDDFLLPANISIIYCSTDYGKENLINRLISFCDKKADEVMNYLKNHWEEMDFERAEVSGKPYSHIRYWMPDDKSDLNMLNLSGF